MNKKIFNPEKYGMVTCPSCDGHGFTLNLNRQSCPTCGGFGFIKKDAEQVTNISIDSESKISPGPNL
jgi:DnaJ-class molecular chaperone